MAIFGHPVGQVILREVVALPQYAEEVAEGLLSQPKTLPCKLFYDAVGSALFEEITQLPEYYLTRTELSILKNRADEMARAIEPGVTVVELGAGTAAKTCTLLEALARRQMRVSYVPVDISPAALREARERVQSQLASVLVRPVVADFSSGFGFLNTIPGKKLVLYLGSSIGNFDPDAAVAMLGQIRAQLRDDDALLLGTDLVKSKSILVPAYDDAQGITARFNKNILCRLDRELGANFDLDSFRHVAIWNRQRSRMEIYLESVCSHVVSLRALNLQIPMAKGERIHTENSYKYTMSMVRGMLKPAGFTLDRSWFDEQKRFALHLARVS
jgi:L-histidine Nalpha-methyltransferase